MKKNTLIIMTLAVLACACNTKETDPSIGKLSEHYIGISKVSFDEVGTKSPADLTASEPELLANSNNFSLMGSVSVEHIGAEAATKADYPDAGEIPGVLSNTNLPTFYIEGFLDDSNPHVNEKFHFIEGGEVNYEESEGKWFFKNDHLWRHRVQHYFWAYSDGASNVSATKDKLEFEFDTDLATKDLVIAKREQFWESHGEGSHDSNDELGVLEFKHAVSAVALKNNISFAKFAIANPSEPVDGKYADDELGPNTKDENEDTPRLELLYAGLLGFTSGKVSAEGSSISWSGLDGYTNTAENSRLATTPIGGVSSYFMIPQLVNTTNDINENAIAVFTIRDNKRLKTQDYPIKLPRFSTGDAPEYWEAGQYYKYEFAGRMIAPYIPEGTADGTATNFAGAYAEVCQPFDPIDLTYVNHLNLNWTVMPTCQSNGLELYIFISPTPITTTPKDIELKTDKGGKETMTVDVLSNPSDFDSGKYDSSTLWLLKMLGSPSGLSVTEIAEGNTVKYNDVVLTEGSSISNLDGVVSINNIDVSKLNGKCYIYFGYKGGNNGAGKCYWTMTNLKLEIID